jgi:hypothetical protein
MSDNLFRLVYCSRNTLGSADDPASHIDQILATSRINNAAAGITGALHYSEGCFAQALEGPLPAVQATFERIQRDWRHTEVVVLQAGRLDRRLFGAWSMALAGPPRATERCAWLAQAFARKDGLSGDDVLDLLDDLISHEGEWVVAAE